MAVSLSNHSLFSPRLSASFPSKSSETLASKFLGLQSQYNGPRVYKSTSGLRFANPCRIIESNNDKYNRRRSFKSHFTAEDSAPSVEEEGLEEDASVSESEAEQQYMPSLKILMKAYKEAIFTGDWKTVSNIEAEISVVENKMNDLALKVSALSSEVTAGKEKYIRLQADFDNFRKRSEKERLTIRSNAQGEVIESLLPMVDNFERAKQQIKPETEKEKKIDISYQGIYKQFVEIMRSLRVASVATVGKPFDPTLHEAIAREESQEYKEGIITQEFRRGFRLGDRLIRPAMVKVSAGPGSKRSPVASEVSTGKHAAAAATSLDEQ
ncbi:protein GrpE isoform X2 [Tripterygium wilfordii]|uniref:protein GrpE isoform X2 n=1 Tax=Tripterygium wilfordii TaxID=458696 RepID=UPI0018F84C42|nr:protein GrpE isoform X2 [Tripterygium wilfordii]